MSGTRQVSYSEISAALACFARLRWDMAYGDQLAGASLKPRATASILSNGRAWGEAVAAWHLTGDTLTALTAASESLGADARAMLERGYVPSLDDFVQGEELVGRCLEHYVEYSGRMENFGQIEREIELPIPARSGSGRDSSKYRYLAKLDGHCTYRGHPAIVEFKFRGKLTEFAVVEKQPQYRWYAWAYAREIDWHGPVSVMVDERLAEGPKPARLVKASAKDITCPICNGPPGCPCVEAERLGEYGGKVRRGYHDERKAQMTVSGAVDQVTTPELYERACFDHRCPTDIGVLRALRERKWSERHILTFTPSELEEAGRELVTGARLVADLDSGAYYPIRNGSVVNCRGCRYKEVCRDPRNSFLVESLFERRPAKRDRGAE